LVQTRFLFYFNKMKLFIQKFRKNAIIIQNHNS